MRSKKVKDAKALGKLAVDNKLAGNIIDVPNDDYHAGPGISSSNIKDFLRSPAHYETYHRYGKDKTDSMILGTRIHEAILEPDEFDKNYYVPCGEKPKKPERPPEWKEQKIRKNAKDPECPVVKWENTVVAQYEKDLAEWEAQGEGRIALPDSHQKAIFGCHEAVTLHPRASRMLEDSKIEKSFYAEDPETGILLKARADAWIPDKGIILDIKTTSDARPREFRRSLKRFGYHISAAFYLHVIGLVYKVQPTAFVLIVVEKSAPYGVRLYRLGDVSLAQGFAKVREALAGLKVAMEADEFPCYPTSITDIDLNSYDLEGDEDE